jgi:hypothetical protein
MKKIWLSAWLMLVLMTVFPSVGSAGPVYSRGSASWYIGFGVGGGGGWVHVKGADIHEQGGGAAMFKIGGVIGPHLLIGFEASAWDYGEGDGIVQFTHNDAMLTWFPWANGGFYLKGGAGLGWTVVKLPGIWGRSRAGFDVRVGIGYEFQLGESFNLGVEGAYGGTIYEDDNTGDTELLLTFSWY